jgi:hypothetical protein
MPTIKIGETTYGCPLNRHSIALREKLFREKKEWKDKIWRVWPMERFFEMETLKKWTMPRHEALAIEDKFTLKYKIHPLDDEEFINNINGGSEIRVITEEELATEIADLDAKYSLKKRSYGDGQTDLYMCSCVLREEFLPYPEELQKHFRTKYVK